MKLSNVIAKLEVNAADAARAALDGCSNAYAVAREIAIEKRAALHQLRVRMRAARALRQLQLDNEVLAYLANQSKKEG